MTSYLFTVAGEPFAKQRPRFNRTQGRTFTPPKTIMYENKVLAAFVAKYGEVIPTEQPVTIRICAIYPVPKSWSKKKKIQAADRLLFPKKHDWDNIGKIICDALNGVVWHDDRQIFSGTACKVYGDRPSVTVEIRTYEESDLKGVTWQALTM